MGVYASPNIVEDGLVLCLDAGNERSYPGTGTTWSDISGNGNNGTLTNGPTYSSDNLGSFSFDGSNDYVTFNNKLTGDFGMNTSAGAAMSCWLKMNILNRWTGVFLFHQYGNAPDFGWDVSNTNYIRIWKNSGASQSSYSMTQQNNQWANFVLVSDSTYARFYVNGEEIHTFSRTGNLNSSSSKYLMFGDHWDWPVSGFANCLKLYNRALSEDEIKQNFNAHRGRFGL